MSFILKNIIWGLYGKWEHIRDTYKVDGKGITQRYNELIAEDFDEEIVPLVEDIVKNTISPSLMMERFIPYWEFVFGTPVLKSDIELRRTILRYSVLFNKVKGTKRGYEMLFNMIGINCTVIESFDFGGFDMGHGFDNPNFPFDSGEMQTYVVGYKLSLTSEEELTSDIEKLIDLVVAANEPINARLTSYTYTTPLTFTTVVVHESEEGLSDGSITVTADGGTPPYEYELIEE